MADNDILWKKLEILRLKDGKTPRTSVLTLERRRAIIEEKYKSNYIQLETRKEIHGDDGKIIDNVPDSAGGRAKTLDKSENSGIIDLSDKKVNIPHEKFTEYALDPVRQPDKARAFKEVLGYTKENYQELINNISKNIDMSRFVPKGNNGYGDRFENVIELTGANGKQANVCTGWIIKNGTDVVSLTSAYVTKKGVRQ